MPPCQQSMVPSSRRAHEWYEPLLIATYTTGLGVGVEVGVGVAVGVNVGVGDGVGVSVGVGMITGVAVGAGV